jgi:tripartite-type tricarboxylate transporter receptor subunit TctC
MMPCRLVCLSLVQFLLLGYGAASAADPWPTRPVHWVVPFPPGGATDVVARIMAQWLSQRLGQSVIVENKSGAAGNIGIQAVAAAPPDGYTLLFLPSSGTVNATLYENLPYNLQRDIAPVAGLVSTPGVMEVNRTFPAKTLPEFISYAKANPGRINMATPGTGTTVHLSGEMLMALTGIKMTHVPYRGGAPAMVDLIAGQVQVLFDVLPGSLAHIKAGDIRPLAVTSIARWPTLPDVATVAETLPGFEGTTWFGVGAPRGTPPEVIARLEQEVIAGLADPAVKARIVDVGAAPMPLGSAALGTLIAHEIAKWAKVVKAAGLKAE